VIGKPQQWIAAQPATEASGLRLSRRDSMPLQPPLLSPMPSAIMSAEAARSPSQQGIWRRFIQRMRRELRSSLAQQSAQEPQRQLANTAETAGEDRCDNGSAEEIDYEIAFAYLLML
jgi:hypothetical protein